jgi:hypothetical protein
MAKNHIFRGIEDTDYTDHYKKIFRAVEKLILDPTNQFEKTKFSDLKKMIQSTDSTQLIGLSDPAEFRNNPDYKYDQVVGAFVQGCVGRLSRWEKVANLPNPIALRSITKTKIMQTCLEQGRDYYYIDTGYFGNAGKAKLYHRITRNAMQYLDPIIDRPSDRFDATGVKLRSFHSTKKSHHGSRILVCPPSEKAMHHGWGLDLQTWLTETVDTIRQHTDREIVIREKATRTERQLVNPMGEALDDNIYCLVTYNSIAAVEALQYGKPIFALGPNAAHHFARDDLSQIENPLIPDDDEVYKFFCHLAYCQFTKSEMLNGTAWAMLNE